MDSKELRQRTKEFALRVIKVVGALPKEQAAFVIGRQLLKSGTSIGANYREALRASSRRHFISTLEISAREADETLYWLELLAESQLVKPARLTDITDECNQLLAILSATIRSTKQRTPPKPKNPKS